MRCCPRFCRILCAFLACSTIAAAANGPLIWADEFNQPENSAPDPTKWVYELGAGGWGNNELQTYTNSRDNSFIASDAGASDGKVLIVKAVKSSSGSYTSARLKTQGKFVARYGRIEARLKSTNGKGLWPAFWMLGENIPTVGWPTCGEIDVMEIIGANPVKAYGTLHGPGYSGAHGIGSNYTLPAGAMYDAAYHVFAVDWSLDRIVWSIDGTTYHTVTPASLPVGTQWVFNDTSFYLLLNLAVGGNWPGNPDATTPFPQIYTVDYVRVYGLATLAAPAEAAGFASGANETTLTWLPAADTASGASYRIERAINADFTENFSATDVGSSTSWIDSTVSPGTTYYYRVFQIAGGEFSAPSRVITVRTPAAAQDGVTKLINVSARAFCERGNKVTIGGFVVTGGAGKRLLVRAVGPTLQTAGLGVEEVLPDPVIALHSQSGLIATNDDWTTNANVADILATAARVGATPIDAADHTSSALLITLPPGVYTFVVTGKNTASGIVLIEAYDAD